MDVYVCVLLESFWGHDLTSGNYTDYKLWDSHSSISTRKQKWKTKEKLIKVWQSNNVTVAYKWKDAISSCRFQDVVRKHYLGEVGK